MKIGVIIIGTVTALILSACGGGTDSSHSANTDPVLQKKADVAKASLQEKADAMARNASMTPPPPPKKK